MEQFLNNPEACFYHIKPFSKWNDIQINGLMGSRTKGISVLRTMEFPIINSIISLQLGNEEVINENDFVLIKIPQLLNNFRLSEIQPDIVFEWTWPLHNSIMRRNIPYKNLELVTRFSVWDWSRIAIEDFRNEMIYKELDLYSSSFNLVYQKNGVNFRVDGQGEFQYI